MLFGELGQGDVDLLAQLFVGAVAQGIAAREPGGELGRSVEGVVVQVDGGGVVEVGLSASGVGAFAIDAEVDGDAVEPGRKGRVALEVDELAVGLDEGVLYDVHGFVAVAQHAEGDGEEAPLVRDHELLKSVGVAGLGLVDEILVAGPIAGAALVVGGSDGLGFVDQRSSSGRAFRCRWPRRHRTRGLGEVRIGCSAWALGPSRR